MISQVEFQFWHKRLQWYARTKGTLGPDEHVHAQFRLVVWVYMYIRRIGFITGNKIGPRDLAVPGALAQLSPPAVSNPSDNLKNLFEFEIPVIFYALAYLAA